MTKRKPEPAPAPAPAPARPPITVTASDALQHLVRQQRSSMRRSAENVLSEIQTFLHRLEVNGEDIPPLCDLSPNSVSRLLTDHATLVALSDALKIAKETGA